MVRKDGKPQHVTHIAAFIDYTKNKVVSYCHGDRKTATAFYEKLHNERLCDVVCGMEEEVSGVDLDVPSPFEVESEADLELASGMAVAGMN